MAATKPGREDPPSNAQLRRELQAMVAAHQELGERFGPELADSFIERLHAAIDERIEARLKGRKGSASPLVLPVVSLIAGLPAMAIAGAIMSPYVSSFAVFAPWIAIVAINVIWAIRSRF